MFILLLSGGYHWMWCFVLVLDLFAKWVHSSHASVQCVQLGQANLNSLNQEGIPGGILYLSDTRRHGYWTIGTRKFDTTHVFLDNSLRNTWFDEKVQDCPYHMPREGGANGRVKLFFKPCPDDSLVTIKTYAVKQDGVVMSGWLHFEIELTDQTDKILAVYVQVRDEVFNAVGEFVQNPEEQCGATKPYLVTPTPYQILPCSAVGRREARLANALYMVRADFLRNRSAGESFLPADDISRGIHFTWRLSEYWCNRHLRIRPEALIFTEKMRAKNVFQTIANINCDSCQTLGPYRKAAGYWLYHGWYGTEDLKLPATTLNCDEEVIDYTTGKLMKKADGTLVAPWLQDKVLKSRLANDYLAEKQRYQDPRTGWQTLKSCQYDTRLTAPTSIAEKLQQTAADKIPTFGGRCIYDWKKEVSHDNLQGCDDPATAEQYQAVPDLPTYGDFVHTLTVNRSNLCSYKECVAPTNDTHFKEILGYEDKSGEMVFLLIENFNNKSLSESRGSKFWSGRKFHAILSIIVTMFILPVGTFAARYLKETYMAHACLGIHAWFWGHLTSVVASMIGIVAALNALWAVINTHGRSVHPPAAVHRIFGYASFFLFFLMLILGGYRAAWDPVKRMMRVTCMSFHAVFGFTQYYFSVATILTSTLIPASPIIDGENCLEDGTVKNTPAIIIVTLIWMGVDLIFHICMTVLLIMVDRQVQIKRFWYCPFVPILPTTSTTDLKGAYLRKIVSLAYVVVAAFLTLANVSIIANNELSEECSNRIGPMSCDLNSPFGCKKFHKDFLSIILSTGENKSVV